jgi:MFS family permease
MLAFGLTPADRYTWSLVGMGTVGLMASFANGSLGPLLQTKVPPEVQGRVFMLLSSLTLAMMPIGLFLSAPIADHFGTEVSYVIGGAACLIIGFLGLMDKRVNTLDLQKEGGVMVNEGELEAESSIKSEIPL